jgi:probable HAF family extracellular repeat protein
MKKIILVLAAGIILSSCHKDNTNIDKHNFSLQEKAAVSVSTKDQTGYQFQALDVPSAWGDNTSAFGNNNTGKVVGNYVTTNGEIHGFIFENGQFTDVFLPEADKDNRGGLTDINDQDIAIGSFNYPKKIDKNKITHSFKRDANGVITILPDALPGALQTEAVGININGTIVGFYQDALAPRHGFILSNAIYTTYDKPNATRTLLTDINNQGKIVGYYRDINNIARGFILFNSITEDVIFPASIHTKVHSINNAGQIVGEYIDASGISHGFLYHNGNYRTLDFPGAFGTALLGINENGVIVGTYNGYSRGLIATPN